jgi:hypothetical protein
MNWEDELVEIFKARRDGRDLYVAPDGKHYWNCWTSNYQPARDGYCIHAFCEEDRSGATLCGVRNTINGGGESFPRNGAPSCLRCRRTMEKRGALKE